MTDTETPIRDDDRALRELLQLEPDENARRENRELLALLAYEVEPVTPAPEVKARLLDAVQDATPAPVQPLTEHPRFIQRHRGEHQAATSAPVAGRRRFRTLLAAAVVAFLMVGMAGWFYVQLDQQHSMVESLQAELASTNSRLEELTEGRQDVLAALRGMSLLPDQPIEVCQLRPPGDSPTPGAHGKLVLAKANDRWWIAVRDLEPVSGDQIYVLWFLNDNQPVKRVNLGRGDREVEINASGVPAFMTAAAITVEDSLDTIRPTGPQVLYGHSREMDRL